MNGLEAEAEGICALKGELRTEYTVVTTARVKLTFGVPGASFSFLATGISADRQEQVSSPRYPSFPTHPVSTLTSCHRSTPGTEDRRLQLAHRTQLLHRSTIGFVLLPRLSAFVVLFRLFVLVNHTTVSPHYFGR
jgi:hypothetical protein